MAIPNTALEYTRAKRIIEDYEWAHKRAFPEKSTSDYVIPFRVMRDYVDLMAMARKASPGLHNITITVTRNPMLGLIHPDIMLASDIAVRVEGAKWA